MLLAVKVGAVATPLPSVVTCTDERPPVNVPLEPVPAAVTLNVTDTPLKPLPPVSFTVACKVAKALLTTTLCVAPLVAVIVAGAVPVPLS